MATPYLSVCWERADWPAPEVKENVNMDELGDLGLSNGEMEDLVAFMRTLNDGWEPD